MKFDLMRIDDPYDVPGTFRKAQLHVHTNRSDGRFEPEEILRRYRDLGFSFVCLTDHDRVTSCDRLNGPEFLALPGIEETLVRGVYPLGPHLGRLLVEQAVGRGSADERIEVTERQGGISVLHHPSWKGNLWTAEWTIETMRRLRGQFLVEIVNPHSNTEEDVRRWAEVLRYRGRNQAVGAVAGDDAHTERQIGRGWIMVKVSTLTRQALADALRSMAFYSTTGPSAALGVQSGMITCLGDFSWIRFIDREGRLRSEVRSDQAHYSPRGDEGFLRIEAGREDGLKIWSNPFWIESVETT